MTGAERLGDRHGKKAGARSHVPEGFGEGLGLTPKIGGKELRKPTGDISNLYEMTSYCMKKGRRHE